MRFARLAALLTVGAALPLSLTTGSASATENLPHFGKCFATAGGQYKNSGCTKLAGAKVEEHKFEWEPLATAVPFTSKKEKETGNVVFETTGGSAVSCTGEKAKGEYGPGNLLKNVVFEFSGCKALGAGCETEGQPAEHINTNKLHGEPGIVTYEAAEEKNIDGYDLRSEGTGSGSDGDEDGELFADFMCGPPPVDIRGSIITRAQADSTGGTSGEWTNKMFSKVEDEYIVETGGKQVPEEWTPNGEGTSNSKHERFTEHLEASFNEGATWEPTTSFSLTDVQSNTPSTTKLELRQCESNIVC